VRPNYYQILELSEQASSAEIRRAYLRLVRITHPDRTPDPAAHQRYLLVNEAYDTLSKPELRHRYDARLAGRPDPQPANPVYTQPFAGNAYQVLRVPYSATLLQIDQAYQKMRTMLLVNTIDPALRQLLRDVEHAYATLRDPRLRIPHDERVRGQRPARRPDPYAALYARYATLARRLCWALLVFFGLMLVDMTWTELLPLERIRAVEYHPNRTRRGGESYFLVKTDRTRFRSEFPFKRGEQVDVRRSVIFRQVRSYQPSSEAHSTKPPYSADMLYGVFFFFPLLMAGLATAGAWPGAPPKRAVDGAIGATLIVPIVLYLIVTG
jgi:hypothetical protein